MKLQDFLEEVTLNQATMLTLTPAKDGKPLEITCGMRALQPEAPKPPVRAETPARCHAFLTPDSLGDYLKKYGDTDTVIYADPDAKSITAVLKEKAEGGLELLTMTPKPHPAATPWRGLAGQTVTLEAFLDVVLLNRRAITKPEPRELVMMLSQLKASKRVEVQRGRGTSHMNGIMIEVKLQGSVNTELVDLPESIDINVPLFHGSPGTKVTLDLTIDATMGNDNLNIFVRVSGSQWAEAELAVFEGMASKVAEKGGKNVGLAVIGKPAHKPWTYLSGTPGK